MSPFCESAKMAASPLNKFPCSKTAPPLPETTAPVLTSLPSPFYKSHCSPRLWAVPSLPSQPGSLGLPLNFALWTWVFSWAFFESSVFPNSFGALNSSSTHVALAVQYKPLPGVWISSDCLLYSCSGLRAFPQFPKEETLFNETEREGENVDLRVPP
jgi:hypothetical protein